MNVDKLIICFTQESGRIGTIIMAQAFAEGWDTLEPLRFSACGHYHTTLYRARS